MKKDTQFFEYFKKIAYRSFSYNNKYLIHPMKINGEWVFVSYDNWNNDRFGKEIEYIIVNLSQFDVQDIARLEQLIGDIRAFTEFQESNKQSFLKYLSDKKEEAIEKTIEEFKAPWYKKIYKNIIKYVEQFKK